MTAWIPAVLLLTHIVGGNFTYTVRPGDSLTSIGARFGVDVRVLAQANDLKTPDQIQVNQKLRIDNQHIVPPAENMNVIVNIPQRMLFYFEQGDVSNAFPIAAGKKDWRTPIGEFAIVSKEENPTWVVPASIQEEMRRIGKPVLKRVPPSPENPLGQYWIGLSLGDIGIHGTNMPTSIYKLETHGCIRLEPDDVRTLFMKVEVGMRGRIIYKPVLFVREGNLVFLEAHPDPEGRDIDPQREILDMARTEGFADMVDFRLVEEVLRKRDGIARDVTLH